MSWHTDPASKLTYALTDLSSAAVSLHGQQAPGHFQIILRHPDWPVDVLIAVTIDPQRGPIASGITSNRLTSDARAVSDVPTYRELADMVALKADVTRLLTEMTAEAVGVYHRHQMEDRLLEEGADFGDDHVRRRIAEATAEGQGLAASAFRAGITQPRRRRLVTPQHLTEVAEIYREAYELGLPPTKTLAERFQISHSTAARWVGRARATGALGPAAGTKPGEATP